MKPVSPELVSPEPERDRFSGMIAVFGDRPECPADDEIAAWVAGSLSAPDAEHLTTHARECADCGELFATLRAPAPVRSRFRTVRWIALAAGIALAILIPTLWSGSLRGTDRLAGARTALASGDFAAILKELDGHIATAPPAERADLREQAIDLLAGTPDLETQPSRAPRAGFRDAALARRTVRFPCGTIVAADKPTVHLTSGERPAELRILRDEGATRGYRIVISLAASAAATTIAWPADAEALAPGEYSVELDGTGVLPLHHGFRVRAAPAALVAQLGRLDATPGDATLRRLCRARAFCDAGFDGEALRELIAISRPSAAVAAWRTRLEQSLCAGH